MGLSLPVCLVLRTYLSMAAHCSGPLDTAELDAINRCFGLSGERALPFNAEAGAQAVPV